MTEFITITLIGLLMIISPGPDFAIVTKTSLSTDRFSGVLSAIGVGIANLIHVSINLLGIGVIIAQSVIAFTILKFLGAAYLLYIGFKGLCAKPNLKSLNNENLESELYPKLDMELNAELNKKLNTKLSKVKIKNKFHKSFYFLNDGFIAGFFTSILNPKACLFYLSFFSVILSSETPFRNQIIYGVWLSILATIWFSLVAVFFTNPVISTKLKNIKHWIEKVAGGALMLLGLRLLSAKASI